MKKMIFRDGNALPALGLGTWKSDPGDVYAAVVEAIKAGYRHIDCAAIYGNEKEIGEALRYLFRAGWVNRKDLWITSKLWNDSHRQNQVEPALHKTLNDLQLDYLDLYLVHWPVALRENVSFPQTASDFYSLEEVPLTETWEAMQAVREKGLAKHIGVSNFSQKKLQHLIDHSDFVPEMNQVELHPFLQQNALLRFCREHQILVTGYSPLGSGDRSQNMKKPDEPRPLQHELVLEIASENDCSPAQVLIAWAIQRGTAVIPKSVNPVRIRENIAAASLQLSDAEMVLIDSLDAHHRIIDGSFWERPGNTYSMAELWDE
ncbi:aldo/keto reductase [bacterium SCSIO 12741]|nr:aldo/keto reductase [bacterium SCSIO 12741]